MGRMKKPTPNTPKVNMSWARCDAFGKKTTERDGTRKPYTEKSYHSRMLPSVPATMALTLVLVETDISGELVACISLMLFFFLRLCCTDQQADVAGLFSFVVRLDE